MAQRKPSVGGNWKMNLHREDAGELVRALAAQGDLTNHIDVAIFPAFPYLAPVADLLYEAGSDIRVGAQDFYHQPNGAFTGEVSLSMLQDIGVRTVLVGHSERRHVLGETDAVINEKVLAALEAGLEVVLCIGEKLEQRESNRTDAINKGQLALGLAGVTAAQMQRVTIAYEPVWAIGTGKTATPEDAEAAHAEIRCFLANLFNEAVSESVRIQYGGSCKPANAAELFALKQVDGGLIGGASLKAEDFAGILRAAADQA